MSQHANNFFVPGGRVGVLLLHGFTSSPTIFKDFIEAFETDSYTVSAPLLAGHGSTNPDDLERTGWREWHLSAHEALEELRGRCDQVFVIGASFGACLACLLAAEEHVDGLVLIGYPRTIYREPGAKFLLPILKTFGMRHYKKSRRYMADDSSVFGGGLIGHHKIPLKSVQQFFHLVKPICDPVLPKIQTPVLIIHSDRDGLVKPDSAHYVFDHLGSEVKQLIWVHEPHHRLHLGKSREQIYSSIINFLDEHRKS